MLIENADIPTTLTIGGAVLALAAPAGLFAKWFASQLLARFDGLIESNRDLADEVRKGGDESRHGRAAMERATMVMERAAIAMEENTDRVKNLPCQHPNGQGGHNNGGMRDGFPASRSN